MDGFGVTTPILPSAYTPHNSSSESVHTWKEQSSADLAAWLAASAQRLDRRAACVHFDRAERDQLLRMATAAWETAAWYAGQKGGAG